ncbi:hypothetical protein Cgig2_009969 [Carnegiea gigantea]|uniref:Uncharacterized protein n=1 Tax=Carnegiea gigantea TaxID=171969 RepID=A0A9Q1JP86_9CARY|nr:hypothetical protein Cgig2_009969 [Carnegiea gigantea]
MRSARTKGNIINASSGPRMEGQANGARNVTYAPGIHTRMEQGNPSAEGAGSHAFLRTLKDIINTYYPKILAIFETKISGQKAEEVRKKIDFNGRARVDAQRFAGPLFTGARATWLTHEGLKDVAKDVWNSNTPLYPLLGRVAKSFGKGIRKAFGNIFFKKKHLWARLEGIQRRLANRTLTHLLRLETKISAELHEVLSQLEILWWQDSHSEAIRDGDQGEWIHEEDEVKRMVYNFFVELYLEPHPNLGWCLTRELESFWSPILRSKYCNNKCDLDMFVTKSDASNAWKGIIENKSLILKGLVW